MKQVIFENSFKFDESRKLYISDLHSIKYNFHLTELVGFVIGFRMLRTNRSLIEFVLHETVTNFDGQVFCWKYGSYGGYAAKIYK